VIGLANKWSFAKSGRFSLSLKLCTSGALRN
jgi:hypothetical protein